MPPLRKRKEDIPILVRGFLRHFCKENNKPLLELASDAMDALLTYDWPGNIRELQNVIERAVVLCDSETFSVDETWLKREGQRREPAVPFIATLVEREKEIIETALATCRGRIAGPLGAAIKLGIPRQTLESKIKSLRIDKHRFKDRHAD